MFKFSMAWTDPKCTKDNLRFGNRVVVRWDNGLPDWGGVIDIPRRLEHGRTGITCYSGERLLDWRVTDFGRYYDEQTPGYIAQKRTEYENTEWATGIGVGTCEEAGTDRTIEDHYHDLFQRMQDMARLSGQDFYVEPTFSGGVLTFALNWYEVRGTDRSTTIWLIDGLNARVGPMDVQGPLQNVIRLIGAGDTWGDDRIRSAAIDAASVEAYGGYREYSEVQSTVSVQTTLDANAAVLLAERKDPHTIPTVEALNLAPALFSAYDVGDIVTLEAYRESTEWYFAMPVRILAREWFSDDHCRLEVQEVT